MANNMKLGVTEAENVGVQRSPAAAPQPVTPTSLFDGLVWRDASVAWLVQRLILLALTYLVLSLTLRHAGAFATLPSGKQVLHVWTNWDSGYFASIAKNGYIQLSQTPYFPIYALLERLLTPFSGGNPYVAGVIITNAACLVAFALLRVLVERECGREIARRTLLYMVIFPYSLFLAAAYTEALFLALSLGTFLAIREHRWLLAGVLATLAALTRSLGILLLIPLIYEYSVCRWRSTGVRRFRLRATDMLALLLPMLSLAGFNLILALHFGTLLPIAKAEAMFWYRRLAWPWEGIFWAISAVPLDSLSVGTIVVLEITFAILLVTLTLAALWPFGLFRSRLGSGNRLSLVYALYTLACALAILVTPLEIPGHLGGALTSGARYMLIIFPLFMVMARVGYRWPWLHRLILVVSIVLALFLATLFIDNIFIG